MKKRTLLVALAISTMLTGCISSKYSDIEINTIAPVGSPAMAFYRYFEFFGDEDSKLEITSQTANVRAAFTTDNYDAIVFDILQASKLMNSNNEAATKAKEFKLSRVITCGNLFLVALNGDQTPSLENASKIVGFAQPGTPGTVYSKLYPELVSKTEFAGSTSQVMTVAKTGLYEGQAVDYVVIAEPYYTYLTLSSEEYATKGKLKIEANLQKEWKTKFKQDFYPQAGLFVRESKYVSNSKPFDAMLDVVDRDLNDLVKTDFYNQRNFLNKVSEDQEVQFATIGVNKETLEGCQYENKNLLGYNNTSRELTKYYQTIGVNIPEGFLSSSYYK